MTKELSKKDQGYIEEGVRELTDDLSPKVGKKYACKFFRGGNHPGCLNCSQPDEKILECSGEWIEQMQLRPAMVWTPELDELEVREKVKLKDVAIGLHCDTCYLSDKCSLFKAKSMCAIDWADERIDPQNPRSIVDYLVEVQGERLQRARMVELTDGGVPDGTLSAEMDRMTGLLATRANMDANKFSLKIEGSSTGNGGGFLAQLFNKPSAQAAITPANDPIVIPIKETEFVEEKLEVKDKYIPPKPKKKKV